MSESKDRKLKRNPAGDKNEALLSINFYGALKSKNEIYFQMASLFKEVTRDDDKLEDQWMKQILEFYPADKYGNHSSIQIKP